MNQPSISIVGATVAMVLAASAARGGTEGLGVDLPPPASGSFMTLLAADAAGGVYACDGDTLYELDGATFSPAYTGISATGGVLFDPSGLALSADGSMAYVASGFTGQVVEVDLSGATPAARHLPGAAMPSGANYGMAVDPVYGKVFVTDSYTQSLYLLDPSGAGSLTLLDDFGGAGVVGGAIAFSPSGELVVPVGKAFSTASDDRYPVDLYRFGRAWLDDLAAGTVTTGAGQRYAEDLLLTGTGSAAVDGDGNAYLAAADALYAVQPDGALEVLAGDTAPHVWNMFGYGFTGLAYDAAGDRLVTAYTPDPAEAYELTAVTPLPEPTSLALAAAGLGLALARRPRR